MNNNQVTINKTDLQALVIYAQRYTIGRMTYAPWEFSQAMLRNLDNLTDNTIHLVIRDIEREFARGSKCDTMIWFDLLVNLKAEMKKREKNEKQSNLEK